MGSSIFVWSDPTPIFPTPLGPASGGTGISSYTIGDLLYASATTTLSKLADVAVGSVLASGGVGVAPAWSATPSLTSAAFGSYVVGTGPFVAASGHRWLHSEAGGGGGGTFENTCFGYDAGATAASTFTYANTLIGKNAGKTLNGTSGTEGRSNVMVGYGSGEFVTTGAFNTFLGTATGGLITTQSSITHVGYHAGNRSNGTGCTFVGNFAGRGAIGGGSGISNTCVGDSTMNVYTTADSCAAFGLSALENVTSGDEHTAVGTLALRAATTSNRCIGLGFSAGRYETGSDKFFVNNQNRSTESGDRTLSLLYGVMAATAASQTLTCNGTFNALYAFGSAGNALTAAGTTRTDALQLAAETNNVTTAASGTGVILPVGVVGMRIALFNAGANAIKVYATASETIDGTAGSTGVTLTNAKRCDYFFVAANTWISAQLGVASA